MSRGPVLGIDIGGTKLAVGVVDGDGRVSGYLRQSTPPIGDGEELLATIVALAGRMAPSVSACPLAVGVGCGGPMRYPAGIVSPLHIPAWRDFPLRARLERAFGLPVIVDNDAKALALGEARFGAGSGKRSPICPIRGAVSRGGTFCAALLAENLVTARAGQGTSSGKGARWLR